MTDEFNGPRVSRLTSVRAFDDGDLITDRMIPGNEERRVVVLELGPSTPCPGDQPR